MTGQHRVRFWTHLVVALVQVALVGPALLWWKDSILFVIGLSLFANFYAAVSAVEAADDSAVLAELHDVKAELAAIREELARGH